MRELMRVSTDGFDYKVEFEPMEHDELAALVAAVIRAAADDGVEFQQILEYCRGFR